MDIPLLVQMPFAAIAAILLYTFIGFIPGTDETSVLVPVTLALVVVGSLSDRGAHLLHRGDRHPEPHQRHPNRSGGPTGRRAVHSDDGAFALSQEPRPSGRDHQEDGGRKCHRHRRVNPCEPEPSPQRSLPTPRPCANTVRCCSSLARLCSPFWDPIACCPACHHPDVPAVPRIALALPRSRSHS